MDAKKSHHRLWVLLLPWLSWGLTVTFYCYQYFIRVSISSLQPDLVKHFHINYVSLASIAAAFYYAFIVTQLFSGFLIDRLGARVCLVFATLMATIGSFVFASSQQVHALEISRVLVGIGAAFSYVGALALCRAWFDEKKFALLNGLTLSIGTLGAFLGEGPLAYLLSIENWRHVLFEMGVLSAVLTVMIAIFVRNSPDEKREKQVIPFDGKKFIAKIKQTCKLPRFWWAAICGGCFFAPVTGFAALWCETYLIKLYQASSVVAGTGASLIFIGVGVGAPCIAWISNYFNQRVRVMRATSFLACLLMLAILFIPMPIQLMFFVLFALGFCVSGFSLVFVLVRMIVPKDIIATLFSVTNFVKLFVGTALIEVIGLLMADVKVSEAGHQALLHFRMALLAIPVSLLLAFFITFKLGSSAKR